MSDGLKRREVVKFLLDGRPEGLLVVAGLGSPCWDLASAGDHERNFYVWGAMGGAAMIGYGIAQGQRDKRVLVLTGDGEMLMGMGAFATIANQPVDNLAIVVLDNGRFGETGGQPTHTAGRTDIAGIAAAAGIPTTATIRTDRDLDGLKRTVLEGRGPSVSVVKIAYEKLKFVLPSSSGSFVKDRFRRSLMGEAAVLP